MRPHPHLDPNLGLGRPYGLPLQAGEVAELSRQTTPLTTACRIALEFLGAVFAFGALAFGLIAFFALR